MKNIDWRPHGMLFAIGNNVVQQNFPFHACRNCCILSWERNGSTDGNVTQNVV